MSCWHILILYNVYTIKSKVTLFFPFHSLGLVISVLLYLYVFNISEIKETCFKYHFSRQSLS